MSATWTEERDGHTFAPARLPHKDIAAALNVLSVMFEHADLPVAEFADQAPTFHWATTTAAAVRELAARLDVEVHVSTGDDGAVHTSFEYGIGRGVGGYSPAYTSALVLRVVHIGEVA